MTKAFSLPGLVAAPEPTVVDLETDYKCDNDVETNTSSPDPSEDVFNFPPQHQPCFTHTLQLCVNDGTKDAGSLRKVIAKASSIVSHARKSTRAADLLEHENRLQTANVTRWNSEVKIIRSMLNIPKEKLDQLDTQNLSHHKRTLLTDIVEILSPLEEATDYAQTHKTTTAGCIIPNFNSKLVSTLTASVTRQFSSYGDKDTLFCLYLGSKIQTPVLCFRPCRIRF